MRVLKVLQELNHTFLGMFKCTEPTQASTHPERMSSPGLLLILTAFLSFLFYLSFPPFLSLLRSAARENKMFSENEIRNILFQVLSGLVFVHKHGKRLYSIILYLLKSCMTFQLLVWVCLILYKVLFHVILFYNNLIPLSLYILYMQICLIFISLKV